MNSSIPPLVSIIIPCYNYGSFLPAALENVLQQSYTQWECIIVDDGSVDDTPKVAESFTQKDSRFKSVSQKNMGLSAARNTGLYHASGKYIQFLDADDLIHYNKLTIQSDYLEAHPSIDIVYGDAVFFNDEDTNSLFNGNGIKADLPCISGSGRKMLKALVSNNFMVVSSPLVRRAMLDRTGSFDTTYKSYEDWQYWFRSVLNGACFEYLGAHGTETYIRQGHTSMMSDKKKLTAAGIQLRNFMMPYLSGPLKMYNRYRLLKLYGRMKML